MSYRDKVIEEQMDANDKFVDEALLEIVKINGCSSEFEDFEFLWSNRDKIKRNRRLIDLLG
jgi:hypothetical protein